MPTELDEKIIPVVLDLLARYGVKGTLSVNAGAYDPATGKTSAGPTEYEDMLLTPPESYDKRYVDNDAIFMTDVRTYMAGGVLPTGVNPKPGDDMTLPDGREYSIISVGYVYSGELIALYDLQLR